MHNRLGRLAGDRRLFQPPGHAAAAALPPIRLKTAADVPAVLEMQIDAVRQDARDGSLEKARLIGRLAAVALKAVEAGNLAARVEMLEAVLRQRREKGEP